MRPSYTSPKHSLPPPEEIVPNEWYTFSLNPLNQYPSDNLNKRWSSVYQEIQAIISQFYTSAYIEGHLEISRTGRIHMHGWIKFEKVADFYLTLPLILTKCTLEIDYINDVNVWEAYVTKSNKILAQYQTFIKQSILGTIKQQFNREDLNQI